MDIVSTTLTYGYTAFVCLLFLAGIGLRRRARSWSTILFVVAMGVALLCQIGQIMAFHIYPIVWDKLVGIVPNASRDFVLEFLLVTNALVAIVGAASLVVFAFRTKG